MKEKGIKLKEGGRGEIYVNVRIMMKEGGEKEIEELMKKRRVV